MHTKPRGQGGLPWRLRLNYLLGRARTCADTDVCNRSSADLSRRVHGDGKLSRTFRERRNHQLTFGRTYKERWRCVARSACAEFIARQPEERHLLRSRVFGIREDDRSAGGSLQPSIGACEA